MKKPLLRRITAVIVILYIILSCNAFVFTNENFNYDVILENISAIFEDGESATVTVDFNIKNVTGNKQTVTPYIAIYTENNELIGFKTIDITIAAGEEKDFSAQMLVPKNKTGMYGKIFALNIENLQPLAETKTFSIRYGREQIENGTEYRFDIKNSDFNAYENLQNMCAYQIAFCGDIKEFNGIQIGKGYNQYQGGSVAIDKSDVKVFFGTAQAPAYTYEHGLTISEYLSAEIRVDYSAQMILEIKTDGGKFKKAIPWDVRYGTLFVKSIGENTLTNCSLSYSCYGLEKDTYIYGNSYLGLYKDKWTKYLIENNHKNIMLNGYSGRASAEALKSLKVDLQYGTPKRIIWAMGMNDGDKGAVNARWKASVEEVMAICKERQIELILCTIPNIPSVDNTFKNAYVEESGYRFVDFASSVGAHNGTTWHEGTLSADNVHPAEQGAMQMYAQAIADVPELAAE